MRRVYREDEKRTSKIALPDHQTGDPLEFIKVQSSLATRETEHDGLQLAGGKVAAPETPPLIDRPNKYTNLKRCVYPDHEGNRWVNRSQFSADKHHSDGLHSYCRACENKRKRLAYIPRWKRGI